ncbi:MAG: SURF1 family protein [Sphingorhabdus sp.]
MKNWPIIPTILVAAAVAVMIGLGVWQLQRMNEKEAVLARYGAALGQPEMAWPTVPVSDELPLFRKSSVNCLEVTGWQSVSGKNVDGKAGIAHLAECRTGGGEGPGALVALGWTSKPENPDWDGGPVGGIIGPHNSRLIRLVVTDDVAGVQKLAPPSTDSIPNNHLLYAIQWFIFAFAAGVIYVLAVRKRRQNETASAQEAPLA